jgi:hypothetical protein
MAQDSKHPDYVAYWPLWQKMDDVLGGEESVKAAGPLYLPMLAEQEIIDYEQYKNRAEFLNGTSKSLASYVGMVFRRDPQAKWPGSETEAPDTPFDDFMLDCTLSGVAFNDYAKEVIRSVLAKGRCLTVIDWSDVEEAAYCCSYTAQEIINWKVERINGQMTLTMLMLYEQDNTFYPQTGAEKPDPYEVVYWPQWREFRLKPDPAVAGQYFVVRTLWRKVNEQPVAPDAAAKVGTAPYGTVTTPIVGLLSSTGTTEQVQASGDTSQFIAVNTIQLLHGGKPLQAIPAVLHGALGPNFTPVRPPLLDLANANLSLYRTAADLDNACHVLGMPTPWAAGFGANIADDFFLGASRALVTDNAAAKCGFLALTGGDLQPLSERYNQKKDNVIALGAKMLDSPSTRQGPEAFGTVALRQSGETATLIDVTIACSQSLEDVMAWALFWYTRSASTPEDVHDQVQYDLNQQFLEQTIDAPTMLALASLWTQGLLSFEDVFWQLQIRGMVPPDRTVEEEKALIEQGQSMVMKMLQAHTGAVPPPGGSASTSTSATAGGIEAHASTSQSTPEKNQGAAGQKKAA